MELIVDSKPEVQITCPTYCRRLFLILPPKDLF